MPEGAEHLAEWFWSLSSSRQHGMFGLLPLSHTEIHAWLSLTGEVVSREEISILRQMDAGFMTGVEEWREWRDALRKPPPTPKAGGRRK